MAKTKKNKNRHNSKKLDVYVVSTKFALIIICTIFCFGSGLIIRQGNKAIDDEIKNSETTQIELRSILRTERAKISSKYNITEIQSALQSHGVNMINIRKKQCYVECLDKNKAPMLKGQRAVAYNN